jgi:hypothetical protein
MGEQAHVNGPLLHPYHSTSMSATRCSGVKVEGRAESPVLWGHRVGGVRSPLRYPTMSGQRVQRRTQLCYRRCLRGHRVEVAWWLELREWEADNG